MQASASPAKKPATKLKVIATPKIASSSSTLKKPKGATAAIKTPASKRKAKGDGAAIADQKRRNFIEVAAYYIAERRGFLGGSELEDWAQAELEIDRLLRENRLSL